VTADLGSEGGTVNYYDPANGFVPTTGHQNSADNSDSPTVTIMGGNEFGYNDSGAQIVTSFSDTGFTFTSSAAVSGLDAPWNSH
jgi:hypothetical protein